MMPSAACWAIRRKRCSSVVIGGKPLAYAVSRDISERKKLTERVHHLANFDLLTDLPNRALLNDRLQQALAKARRDRTGMALMFADLDKFKPVNDVLGHHIGDLLLKEAASIGIAIYPEHGADESLLLKHADSAMYQAKQSGGAVVLWDGPRPCF